MANAADRTVVRNLDLSDLSHVVSFATLVRNRERRRKRQQAASERIARLQLLIAEATREVASLLAEFNGGAGRPGRSGAASSRLAAAFSRQQLGAHLPVRYVLPFGHARGDGCRHHSAGAPDPPGR